MESVFQGHTTSVKKVVITTDDAYLVTGCLRNSTDYRLIIWNLREKRLETVLKPHEILVTIS